ncbi:MAG: PGF-pre-PGF domain-containing protein, partial [Methanosarcinales archaeon]|nr:PGF-pre-PGF domain-containing protein [Methanosarcinales archaeon]
MSVTKILHISMLCVVFLMIAFVFADTSVADNSIHAVTFSGTSNTDGSTNTGSGSGGGGSGGGGGGGGGSNEPTANIETNQVQYVQKVAKGTLDYTIDGPKTEVVGVKFNVLKTPSNEVEIRIQKLKERSVSTNSDPPGKVYSHMNIICSLQSPNEMGDAKIRFEVSKNWIESMSGKVSDVKLVRYNSDKWNVLPTSAIEETNDNILFEAETPGFSSFAISMVDENEIISKNGEDTNAGYSENYAAVPTTES